MEFDNLGRPINPKYWTDEMREESKRNAEEARKVHGERCRERRRVNGYTKADH